MSKKLLVATRKGLFTLQRQAAGWKIITVDFLGQNATMCMQDGRDQAWYVSLNHGHFGVKLHRSFDHGASWQECAVPSLPAMTEDDHRRQAEAGEFGARRDFSKLHEIWELTPGGSHPTRIWAGTIPGALFWSDDRGDSWNRVDSLWQRDDRWRWFGGGKDSPGIHSICVDPRDPRCVTVAISCGGVWHTTDAGVTWESRTKGLRAEYMPPEQAEEANAQDPHRMVQSFANPDVMWIQHHNGIFHTVNRGLQWQEYRDVKPAVFGFAVIADPHDANTAWFVPGVKDECRVPVEGKLVVTRTRDGGRSFEILSSGLPQEHCYDIVLRHGMDIAENGSALAMGSSTGSLWVSEAGGEAWSLLSHTLPPIYCVRFVN